MYIADSCFTVKELKNIEDKVCQVLEFRVQRVSPVQFLNHFLKASYACTSGSFCSFDHPVLRNMTMYILELSRLSYDLVAKKPSLVAAASLYLARATLGMLYEYIHIPLFLLSAFIPNPLVNSIRYQRTRHKASYRQRGFLDADFRVLYWVRSCRTRRCYFAHPQLSIVS